MGQPIANVAGQHRERLTQSYQTINRQTTSSEGYTSRDLESSRGGTATRRGYGWGGGVDGLARERLQGPPIPFDEGREGRREDEDSRRGRSRREGKRRRRNNQIYRGKITKNAPDNQPRTDARVRPYFSRTRFGKRRNLSRNPAADWPAPGAIRPALSRHYKDRRHPGPPRSWSVDCLCIKYSPVLSFYNL